MPRTVGRVEAFAAENLYAHTALLASQRSAAVLVSDDVFGGGERAVLEARSLGVAAVVEPDNPKLAELLTSPLYDHAYYAAQMSAGLALLDLRIAQTARS